MARNIGSYTIADFESGNIVLALFVEFPDFITPLYLTSLPYNITVDSIPYLGIGNLGSITAMQEATDLSSNPITLSLSGLTQDAPVISVLSEVSRGDRCYIKMGILNSDHSITDGLILLFSGIVDTTGISYGKTPRVDVTVNSRLSEWERIKSFRFNYNQQTLRYPLDSGLNKIAEVVDKEVSWGPS